MNTDCDRESGIRDKTVKLWYFYKANLSNVYATLLDDFGYSRFEKIADANKFNCLSKGSYQNHQMYLYKLMDSFYNDNLEKIHQDVKGFYYRNHFSSPANDFLI